MLLLPLPRPACGSEGDQGDKMYVIMHGTAVVTKARSASSWQARVQEDTEDEGDEIMQLDEEMYFGERALLDNAPRAASVRALRKLQCMAIDRATFERLLGPLQHIIDADRQRREQEAAAQRMRLEAAGLCGVSFSSFRFEAPMIRIETGGVLLVRHLISGESYTIRAESKHKLHIMEQTERISRELEVLHLTGVHAHLPVLPGVLCTFASPLALFALFKTRVACELSCLTTGAPLPPNSCRYVSACVVAALERLHCHMNTVYRNMSPGALSLDEHGCVCLMDFRNAKVLSCSGKTFTLCGVADYLSPEQVTCAGHSFSVDFWAMGVLLWELASGIGPWGNEPNEVNIYRRITEHNRGGLSTQLETDRERGFIPSDCLVPSLIDLIDRLLVPEPLERLGAAQSEGGALQGFQQLRSHPWFSNVRWDSLAEGNEPSPFLTSAATRVREQLQSHAEWSNDGISGEVMDATEYGGDGSWFAQY